MARYRGRHAAQQKAGKASGHRRRFQLSSSRYRRGLGGTAIAAVVMAALTASQAPGVELGGDHGKGRSDAAGDRSPGDDSYETQLPPLESPHPPEGASPGGSGDESGIPASVLKAYKDAAKSLASRTPGCGLRWELLAGIGKVESGQARGGAVDKDGTTLRPILGPVLNGAGFANIKDTDGGRWDGDTRYDRAVGPMQFIPSTWDRWGADGNGDGRKDPNNVYDAALAAGQYLCADGRDLSAKADLDRAILSYNNSDAYLRTVLAWFAYYREGTHSVPDTEGPLLPTSPGLGESGGGPDKGGSPSGPGKGTSPSKPSEPSKPGKPSEPGNPGGGGDHDGGDDGDDGGTPSPDPTAPDAIVADGTKSFSAVAGEKFAKSPRVKVETSKGKGVKGVKVDFAIDGATEASFDGGAKKATVTTDAKGFAEAPGLDAGAKVGSFTVHASVPGKKLGTVDFTAEVAAAEADKLERTSEVVMSAPKNSAFALPVKIKATRKGEPVANTAVTAKLDNTTEGPHFENDKGEPVRTPVKLTTNEDGVAEVGKLFADDKPGDYTLTLTAEGGATVTVKLTITG
ncbi:lytic transglycosylase domain-containing protein [Streptomyces diacarni]|uniref:lytic transglycosylase domain-containing protein n=1 Tax=Streptomyces diacarni TaxID=2800381 RepID=UPI0033E53C8A